MKVSGWVALIGGVGGFLTIGLLGLLTNVTPAVWLMAPFGASCVLAFVVWDAPLSQPRNIIGGHFVFILAGNGWSFLLTPVLSGAVLVVIVALVVNNFHRKRQYPVFWL